MHHLAMAWAKLHFTARSTVPQPAEKAKRERRFCASPAAWRCRESVNSAPLQGDCAPARSWFDSNHRLPDHSIAVCRKVDGSILGIDGPCPCEFESRYRD